jgi:hypothetical protein
MNFPNTLIEAVKQHWPVESAFDRDFRVQELKDDWIVWRAQDSDKAGGMRLVVPKAGTEAFEIPSSAVADDRHGVSSDYIIHVEPVKDVPKEAAVVLEKHTGIPLIEAYRCLKSGVGRERSYFIVAPLEMMRELAALNVHVRLERPGGRGGYSWSGNMSTR